MIALTQHERSGPRWDLRPVESRRTRSGWRLKCPACGRWVRALLTRAAGQLVCARCRLAGAGG